MIFKRPGELRLTAWVGGQLWFGDGIGPLFLLLDQGCFKFFHVVTVRPPITTLASPKSV